MPRWMMAEGLSTLKDIPKALVDFRFVIVFISIGRCGRDGLRRRSLHLLLSHVWP